MYCTDVGYYTETQGAELVILGLTAVVLLVAAALVLTRFSAPNPDAVRSYGSDSAFLDQFSVSRYRPVLRLASRMDRSYLEKVHGKPLASCYRKMQRTILREYLRELSKDVNRLYAILNARSANARNDEGNVSLALTEQQTSFALLIWGIEARLVLDVVMPGPLNIAPLMSALDALTSQTQAIASPQLSYHVV
jgi:hypothetical protein